MAIRAYLAVEDRGLATVSRSLGHGNVSPMIDPLEQPYITFPDVTSIPSWEVQEKVQYWTFRQIFLSRDGFKFTPGRYPLEPEMGFGMIMISAKVLGDEVEYTVNGRFNFLPDLVDTIDELTYGKFPRVPAAFAVRLLFESIKTAVGLRLRQAPYFS